MDTSTHLYEWQWKPWMTVAVGCLIVLSPWLAALALGEHFTVINAIMAGAGVAIVVGVAALVALVVTMFRTT